MKIDIISMWYNESFLVPFFLKHYSWADTIHLLIDEETTDSTLEIVQKFDNVEVIPVRFPDMLDDLLKVKKINNLYRSLDSDWVIAVDSDEFVFPLPLNRDIRDVLQQESKYNLLYAQMWQVYRHRCDSDLDPNLPAILQRRHGDPDVSSSINASYVKPIVVRSSLDIEWAPGCHVIWKSKIGQIWDVIRGKQILPSPHCIYGAHWAMADPELGVLRRIQRKERISKRNLELELGSRNFYITEEQIREECSRHLDDPILF